VSTFIRALALSFVAGTAYTADIYKHASTSPAPPEPSSPAGALDFQTDTFTGRFQYRFPIRVAPARQGSEPKISLVYGSGSGNGWCGVGWALDLGVIQRETRYGVPLNWQNGIATSYDNAKGFVFSFQGINNRLVSIGNGEYRAASDREFLTFTAGESDGWVVYDKSGNKFTFLPGLVNPRMQPSVSQFDKTFLWNLERIQTANSNLTLIEYFTNQMQRYPQKIWYNGRTNFPYTHSVEFVWEDDRLDVTFSYIGGFRVTTAKRLKEIVAKVGQDQVRKYILGYTNSPSTGRSLLTRIDEQGSDATATLPPVMFEYQEKGLGFGGQSSWANLDLPVEVDDNGGLGGSYGWYRKFLDIDGDALPDIIERTLESNTNENRFMVRANRSGGMAGFGGLHSQERGWAPIYTTPSEDLAPRSPVFLQWDGPESYVATVADLLDINGDGYLDRVSRAAPPYANFWVRFGTGLGFLPATNWGGVFNPPDSWVLARWGAPTASNIDGEAALTRVTLTDMNADGLPDRVLARMVAPYDFRVQINKGWSVDNGWSFDPPLDWTNVLKNGWNEPHYHHLASPRTALIDLNGDSLPDRILRRPESSLGWWRVQFNNGAGFDNLEDWGQLLPQSELTASRANPDCLFDINCDGLPDKLFPDVEKVQFNTGTGFGGGRDITVTAGLDGNLLWGPVFRDVNGDGILDYIHDDGQNYDKIRLGNGPYPDLLKAVRNGIGGSIEVTYRPSTHYDNRDRAWTGDPWAAGAKALLPYVVQTVATVTLNGGLDGPQTTTYSYTNGFHDADTREFRGFARSEVIDPLGTKTITMFHQGGGRDFAAEGEYQDADSAAKKGMPFCIEVWGSDAKLYSRTLNKIEEAVLHANGWVFPYVSQTITTDFDPQVAGQQQYSRSRAKLFEYDTATGNLEKESDLGEVTNVVAASHSFVDIQNDSVFTHAFYAQLTNTRIIDKPQVVSITAHSSGAGLQRYSRFTYNQQTGAPLTNEVWINTEGRYATVSSFTYDQYGNVSCSVDAAGVFTGITYDANQIFPQTQVTASYSTSSQTFDPRSGALLSSTDPKGLVTAFTYDKLYRLTGKCISTEPYQATNLWKESYSYALGGIGAGPQSFNYVKHSVNDATDTNGHVTYVYSDGLGRPIRTLVEAEPDGSGNARFRAVDTFYDARGNTEYQSRQYFVLASAPNQRDATKPRTRTQYDPLGRPSIITPPVGDADSPTGPSTTVYREGSNPWAVTSTDAKNNSEVSRLDAYGRAVHVVETGNIQTSYTYDKVGNLVVVDDAHLNQTQISYDTAGRKSWMEDPDMGYWEYFYDDAGRLTMQIDPAGRRIDYVYTLDMLSRLTDKYLYTWNPAVNDWSITDIVLYDYDVSDDPAFTVYKGQLYRIWDTAGTERFSYDVRGRVLKKERGFYATGQTFITEYTYDDADRVSSITYPGNIAQVKYSYDTATHLKKVEALSSPFGPQVFYEATAFTEHDQIATVKWRNNSQTTTTYSYFPLSRRLSRIQTTRAGAVPIQDLSYKYDAVANVTSIADAVNLGNACDSLQNITYDGLYRLKSYTREGLTTSFNYDNIGNITLNQEMGAGAYVYDLRPHAVSNANGRVYGYDAAGNMTSRNGQALAYDVESRLRQVNDIYYFYNDDGERVRKTSFAGETVWIDDIYEREGGWRILCHVQAGGKRIVTFSADGGEVYYYHADHLGSSSLMTDYNGSLVSQQYGYRCFGSERFALSWPSFTCRFTGQPYDAETGLYYYQSRYYDPELGRFIQPDSIVPNPDSSQSLNRYSYVLNNPLKYVDPTGHGEQGSTWGLYSPSYTARYGSFGMPHFLPPDAGGLLGFGAGRDWLGMGWGGGTRAYDWNEHWRQLGFPDMNDVLAGSPSSIDPYQQASFLQKWKARPAQALEDTLINVASITLMAIPEIGPIARTAAAGRVGAAFVVPRVAKSSVWQLGGIARGTTIESRLAATEYSGWFRAGQLNNGRFPLIDFQKGNNLVSLKTVNTTGSTWLQRMQAHIQNLGTRGASVNGNPASMILDIRVQPGGAGAAQQLIRYGQKYGVNVMVKEFP